MGTQKIEANFFGGGHDGESGAVIISPNGGVEIVALEREETDRLSQLNDLVGGFIEAIPLSGGKYMVIREDAKLYDDQQVNVVATALARDNESIRPDDCIVGVAVIVNQVALA